MRQIKFCIVCCFILIYMASCNTTRHIDSKTVPPVNISIYKDSLTINANRIPYHTVFHINYMENLFAAPYTLQKKDPVTKNYFYVFRQYHLYFVGFTDKYEVNAITFFFNPDSSTPFHFKEKSNLSLNINGIPINDATTYEDIKKLNLTNSSENVKIYNDLIRFNKADYSLIFLFTNNKLTQLDLRLF